MFLQKLSLLNFKNYPQLEVEFSPKINCFTGNNGAGKTNLLDAIYYLSMCKSFFNSSDTQLVKHQEKFFVLQGTFLRNEHSEVIYCGFQTGQKKKFKRNDKEYRKLSQHIGLLPIVMVSPADTNLIVGGSEERRKYLDSVISQYDSEYLDNLIHYNRCLVQRNALLKEMYRQPIDHELLEVWDEQLVGYGEKIFRKRLNFTEKLLPIFQEFYDFISKGNEKVELIYHSQFLENDYKTLINKALEKDKILQYTSVGVHKDDLLLNIGEYPIKKLGSQGQQKTYLTALKLAQFRFMSKLNASKPILLLDDIFDKLDHQRVEQILSLVSQNHFGQIFITDTSTERLETILHQNKFEYRLFPILQDEIITEQ